jgi:hypothetical protein
MVQFVMSSESIDPSKPNRAPDAPTETPLFLKKRAERTFPPNPDMMYIRPTLTETYRSYTRNLIVISFLLYSIILVCK